MLQAWFLDWLLSHAAIEGFLGGAAIIMALQQLKDLLGRKDFTKKIVLCFVGFLLFYGLFVDMTWTSYDMSYWFDYQVENEISI